MVKHPEILLEDRIYNEHIRHGGPHLNGISTDQTAWVHKMFCAFVVCLQQNHDQGSQSRGLPDEVHRFYEAVIGHHR